MSVKTWRTLVPKYDGTGYRQELTVSADEWAIDLYSNPDVYVTFCTSHEKQQCGIMFQYVDDTATFRVLEVFVQTAHVVAAARAGHENLAKWLMVVAKSVYKYALEEGYIVPPNSP